mmetsp:Transcript_27749/g.70796  ORF Transcript_27749/g.70796 Transcript_27749/m.70796 type:complete len:99 (+) Transcript_27749:567-863(+)
MNWLRAVTCMCNSMVKDCSIGDAIDVTRKMNAVCDRTRFVDDIEGVIAENLSLRELYWHRDMFASLYKKALESGTTAGGKAVEALLRTLPDIPFMAHR